MVLLRQLFSNALARLALSSLAAANVDFVSAFNLIDFGFRGFRKGVKPSDHQVDIMDQ